MLFGLASPEMILSKTGRGNLPERTLKIEYVKYIRDVWDMWSRYADTPREACFHSDVEVHTREYCFLILKLRRGAMNVWQKV